VTPNPILSDFNPGTGAMLFLRLGVELGPGLKTPGEQQGTAHQEDDQG
jgi:hypothetical protein